MLYFSINHILLKWKHTLIQALEIAVIMFLGVIIITTFFHQSKKYEPFREVLQGEGVRAYSHFPLGSLSSGFTPVKELMSSLKKATGYRYTAIQPVYVSGLYNIGFQMIGYDKQLSQYKPDMKEGVWYTDYTGDGYSVVVTENEYGIQTGDVFDLYLMDDNGDITINVVTVTVCGVMRNGESYYAGNSANGEGDINRNYKVFDSDTNFWDKDTPLMFFALENMQELKFGTMACGFFIEYDDSITEEEKEYNEDVLAGFNCFVNSYEEMRESSMATIMEKLMEVIPIAIGLLFFITVNIICNSSMDTNKNLREYAVYFMTGMRWGNIIVMKILEGIITGVFGLAMMFLLSQTIIATILPEGFLFSMGTYQWGFCALVIVYEIVVSVIVPVFVVKKNQPVDVLREARV